jgi:hypothetical protein
MSLFISNYFKKQLSSRGAATTFIEKSSKQPLNRVSGDQKKHWGISLPPLTRLLYFWFSLSINLVRANALQTALIHYILNIFSFGNLFE